MKVGIKVHESHVNMVRAGQPAFVVLDPMPDKRFQGMVSKSALLPDTQSMFGNPNLKVYKTEVVITDPLPDVKPGVSARAEIIITNIPRRLTVPPGRHHPQGQDRSSIVPKGETAEPRTRRGRLVQHQVHRDHLRA